MKLVPTTIRHLLVVLSLFVPHAARACIIDAPFHLEDIRRADAIFTGTVVHYEIVSPGQPDSLDDYGLVTVRVKEVIRGNVSGDVQLYWWNSTFAMPDSLLTNVPSLFAAVDADSGGLPLRGGSATVIPTHRRDLLQLMQAPCSDPFILPYDQSTMQKVQDALKGHKIGSYDLYAHLDKLPLLETKAIHRKERKSYAVYLLVTIPAALLVLLTIWVRNRRRRNTTAALRP